jgi:hypothetical protein
MRRRNDAGGGKGDGVEEDRIGGRIKVLKRAYGASVTVARLHDSGASVVALHPPSVRSDRCVQPLPARVHAVSEEALGSRRSRSALTAAVPATLPVKITGASLPVDDYAELTSA